MKCPHCAYEDGWSNEKLELVNGDVGGFFALPVEVTRVENDRVERKQLCACPKCGLACIDPAE